MIDYSLKKTDVLSADQPMDQSSVPVSPMEVTVPSTDNVLATTDAAPIDSVVGDSSEAHHTSTDPTHDQQIEQQQPAETLEIPQENVEPQENAAELLAEQFKWITTMIRSMKKKKDASFFLYPVDPVKLGIPTYFSVVQSPMDISTIEKKLSSSTYKTVDEVKSDFILMFTNCYTFNGLASPVSIACKSLQKHFDKEMEKMPNSLAAFAEKKRKSSQLKNEFNRPTRDSFGGLKKRHGKRDTAEMKFCAHIIRELTKKQHSPYNLAFLAPVDPDALGIPHYRDIIKNPMDLGTIRKKLDFDEYESCEEFAADVRLMFSNCFTFNAPASDVYGACEKLESVFNNKWGEQASFLAQYAENQSRVKRYEGDSSDDPDDEDYDKIQQLRSQMKVLGAQLEMLLEKQNRKRKRRSVGPPPQYGAAQLPQKPKSKRSLGKSPDKKSKKKRSHVSDDEREPDEITYEQKRELSENISILPADKLPFVFEIIKENTNLGNIDNEEIELDIDSLPKSVVWKLYLFVRKHTRSEKKAKMFGDMDGGDRKFAKKEKKVHEKPKKKEDYQPFRTERGDFVGASFKKDLTNPLLYAIPEKAAPQKETKPDYSSVLDNAWQTFASKVELENTNSLIPAESNKSDGQSESSLDMQDSYEADVSNEMKDFLDIQGPLENIDEFQAILNPNDLEKKRNEWIRKAQGMILKE